jgi:phosphoglycerate dehydrogenase-like enzyme
MKQVVCCGTLNLNSDALGELKKNGFEFIFPLGSSGKPANAEEEKNLREALKTAEGFISGGVHVTDELLNDAPKLEAVVFCGTGFASFIDVEACKKHCVKIGYCPGANAQAVAEFSSALLTAGLKNIPWFNAQVKNGLWSHRLTPDICDQTLGFVGLGNVGIRLARIMHGGYGCKILYYCRSQKPDAEKDLGAVRMGLDELLAESTVVILCITLSDETKGLINRERIAAMKDGALLLNLARSEVVDTSAVLEALEKGKLSRYVTDVFHEDPVAVENARNWKGKYPGDDKLIVTPHTCFNSPSTARQIGIIAIDTVQKLLNGEDTPNRVQI